MLYGSPALHLITAHIKHVAKDFNVMWDQLATIIIMIIMIILICGIIEVTV